MFFNIELIFSRTRVNYYLIGRFRSALFLVLLFVLLVLLFLPFDFLIFALFDGRFLPECALNFFRIFRIRPHFPLFPLFDGRFLPECALNFFLLFRIRPHFPLFDVFSGKCVRAISRDFPHIVNKPKVNNMH